MRKTLLALCFAVLFASGCAKPGQVGSFCGPLPERSAVSAIAADAVACLSDMYPPGHTSLHLLQTKDAANDFAAAFESGLRSQGFTLAAAESADVIVVAYTLDALDEKSAWYLQLRLSDGRTQPAASRKLARAARNRNSGAPSQTKQQKKPAMPGIPAQTLCKTR